MSYHALYRAHRPQKFSDVVGQKHIVRTVQNALKHERYHMHIYSVDHVGQVKHQLRKLLQKLLTVSTILRPNRVMNV